MGYRIAVLCVMKYRLAAPAAAATIAGTLLMGHQAKQTVRAPISPHQKRPTKTISGKTYELNLFTGFCKKSYIFGFHQKSKPFQKSKPLDKKTLAPLPRGAK